MQQPQKPLSATTKASSNEFASFAAFYPFYLSEHRDPACRRLHFVGTSAVVAMTGFALARRRYRWLWSVPFLGYGFAWVGHVVFERNRPATFRYPRFSLIGDFVMWKDILIGRLSL